MIYTVEVRQTIRTIYKVKADSEETATKLVLEGKAGDAEIDYSNDSECNVIDTEEE